MNSFGMFSEAGDKAVSGLVTFAKEHHLDWDGVEGMLVQLSKKYAEATDTVVRECVYHAMGY